MKTPTDFLRALAARVGLLKDHNRPIDREARFYVALGGEIRNEAKIQAILKKTPPEDRDAMRRILGVGSIFLALLVTPTGEASNTNPHPRATGAASPAARAHGNGVSAGAVIVSLPRTTRPSGQFRRGASERNAQRVIGSRVLRSVPLGFSGKQKSPEIGANRNGGAHEEEQLTKITNTPGYIKNNAASKTTAGSSISARDPRIGDAAGGFHGSRDTSRATLSGPRVRPAARGKTKGAFSFVSCCAHPTGVTKAPPSYLTQASWYGEECANAPMANGAPFNPSALTCASWFHPLGSRLKVSSGARFVVVTVTDRGPAMDLVKDGRGIDLSREAFRRLATLESGLVMVKLEEL